jgi:deoxyribodipyrimidine photo-lyase
VTLPDRPVLYWFRDDLRLADSPGLFAALAARRPLVRAYVLGQEGSGARTLGGSYPGPIIDHSIARQRVLDAYGAGLKSSSQETSA